MCGVFGIYNNPNSHSITFLALHALQHRGQEGAGIAVFSNNDFQIKKGIGLVKSGF